MVEWEDGHTQWCSGLLRGSGLSGITPNVIQRTNWGAKMEFNWSHARKVSYPLCCLSSPLSVRNFKELEMK